jgi:hypothetical protein
MKCTFCGKYSGLFSAEHLDCAQAAWKVLHPEEKTSVVQSEPAPTRVIISVWKIAFGVLLGNLITGIIFSIVYAMNQVR